MNQNFAEFDPFKITPILEWLQPPRMVNIYLFYWSLHFWQKNAMHIVLIQSTPNQHKPLIRFTFETKKKKNWAKETLSIPSIFRFGDDDADVCCAVCPYNNTYLCEEFSFSIADEVCFFYSFLGCEEEFTTLAEKSLFTLHRFDVQMCV